MKDKKYIRSVIIAFILMVIVGITGYIAVRGGNNGGKDNETEPPQTAPPTDSAGAELNIIEGGYSFFPDDVLPADADASAYTLPAKVCGIDLPYTVNGTPFVITRIAKYSGTYVEDMSDDEVDSCLAIIVKNNTDDIVMNGTLIFEVNGSEEAVFKVNTLPAGKSCVLLEQNRRKFSVDDILVYDGDNEKNEYYTRSAEEQKEVSIIDKLQITGSGNSMTLKNRGGESYNKIYVLYKSVRENVYFGGITYKLEFDSVAPGAEITQDSKHYDADKTEVVTADKVE